MLKVLFMRLQHKRDLKRSLILKFTLNCDHIYNRVFTGEQQSVYGGGGGGRGANRYDGDNRRNC